MLRNVNIFFKHRIEVSDAWDSVAVSTLIIRNINNADWTFSYSLKYWQCCSEGLTFAHVFLSTWKRIRNLNTDPYPNRPDTKQWLCNILCLFRMARWMRRGQMSPTSWPRWIPVGRGPFSFSPRSTLSCTFSFNICYYQPIKLIKFRPQPTEKVKKV